MNADSPSMPPRPRDKVPNQNIHCVEAKSYPHNAFDLTAKKGKIPASASLIDIESR